jgi:hypothetical protein
LILPIISSSLPYKQQNNKMIELVSKLKVGDKIVCVSESIRLTTGKTYTVFSQPYIHEQNHQIPVIDDSGTRFDYTRERFITLTEYRNRKLSEILK